MIIALGDIYARIADRDQVAALMRATQKRARAEPGCVDYAFAETLDDPGHFVVVQQWRDRASLEQHYRSEAFAEYQAVIGEHVVRISELRLYEAAAAAIPIAEAPIAVVQED
jgi:quinol monooxygenase YgiN